MGTVSEFTRVTGLPLDTTPLLRQLVDSRDVHKLAFAIFRQDQERGVYGKHLLYADLGDDRPSISSEQRAQLRDRACIAMLLGDADQKPLMVEAGALEMLGAILRAIRTKQIGADHPLARLDLTTARAVAELAISGALNYGSGYPLRPPRPLNLAPIPAPAPRSEHVAPDETTGTRDLPAEETKPADTSAGDQKDPGDETPANDEKQEEVTGAGV